MYQNILQHNALKKLIKEIFLNDDLEFLKRPQSIIIKKKEEMGNTITRIILLSPKGYSSNNINELSPHDEVRKAKITLKGIIKKEKQNFSLIKNCLKFAYLTNRNALTEKTIPYALISDNKKIYKEKIFSSKNSIYIVRENGEGFYHNLINLSDNWLVLVLVKELRSGKTMDIKSKTDNYTLTEKKLFLKLINEIEKYGDELFIKNPKLIKNALEIKTEKSIPVLIKALNVYETGRHEPCTVYALILHKAKTDKIGTLKLLKDALKSNKAPIYYLSELINKIDN